MSYIALYRKWRPLTFESVVEQEHVVKTLRYSVSTGRIAHAYLFCGTRGTGKTTMAHILSRAINCISPKDGDPCNECEICRSILSGSSLDVLEIDAASNNSVDNVREIRDEVIYSPSQARYKVYIIDEVHMLSTGAFNALLKTLEEPPAHVVFILATTEPHKLPATILSRCQRFDFRRISSDSTGARLNEIAEKNGINVHKDALKLIARLSDGALRDAISLLDQCMSSGAAELTYNDVLATVGIVNDAFMADTVDALAHRDLQRLLELVENLIMAGKDISQFTSDLVLYLRNMLICKITNSPEEIIEVSDEVLDVMRRQCEYFDKDRIIFMVKNLSSLGADLKWSSHPRVLLEVALIKLCENISSNNQDVLERLSLLEKRVDGLNFTAGPAKAALFLPEAPIGSKASPAKESKPVDASPANKPAAAEPVRSNVLECWPQILKELRGFGRMQLYTALLEAKAVELSDKLVGIVFGSNGGFQKMLVSKAENLEVVSQIVSRVIQREVAVKCLDEGETNQKKEAGPARDDLLEKARDMAERFNIPFNVIDE
jgi:DNA polymerase-3 subunit gamma/tau